MNNIEQFEKVIEYIEENLWENIETKKLAKILKLSVYEFRRIFSFIAGVPVGEYIRKRRLSVAAHELVMKKCSITEIALKCGYDSPSSFSRAFKGFHNCTPNEIQNHNINMLTKISLFAGVVGGNDFSYKIVKLPKFTVSGIRGVSDDSDTECCENVWQKFYREENGLIKKGDGKIYAVYQNRGNFVDCLIGVKSEDGTETEEIPESLWACFTIKGADDITVNGVYSKIFTEWAQSGNVRIKSDYPNLEIFPEDMESDGFLWEILIPIVENAGE